MVRTARPLVWCVAAMLACSAAAATARAADPAAGHRPARVDGSHVRGATPRMSRLVADAITRSPTFAALVAALNRTDLIVHVEDVGNLPSGVDGRLVFATAAGGVRYLRAHVRSTLPPSEMAAVVGHELQHAMEVAAHAEVSDARMFRALYERIGEPMSERGRFDTAAARAAGRQVRREL